MKNFLFLADYLALPTTDYVWMNGFHLKKAKADQIRYIKEVYDQFASVYNLGINIYESKWVQFKSYSGTEPLNQDDWNYWIIEYDESLTPSYLIGVLAISKPSISTLFTFEYNEGKVLGEKGEPSPFARFHPIALTNFFLDRSYPLIKEKQLLEEDKTEIQRLLEDIERLRANPAYEFILNALLDYPKIQEITFSSPFKLLSYFSLLESLLTSSSNDDRSITHQLCQKINLINNNSSEPLDFRNHFKIPNSTPYITIIKHLYSYRSKVAHGEKVNLNDNTNGNKLKELNSEKAVKEFLPLITKQAIKFALKNPQLIKDLKEC